MIRDWIYKNEIFKLLKPAIFNCGFFSCFLLQINNNYVYFVFQSTLKINTKDYSKDLSDIRNFMSRSSQFASLSGLSGILAGIYAIAGAFIARILFFPDVHDYGNLTENSASLPFIILILFLIACLSILTAVLLSRQRAKINNEKLWSATSKRMLINFCIPMITGGIYIFIQLNNQHYGITAALMLIFYGLSLVSASTYTVGTIKYLGYTQIITGLICALFPGWGFWFWIIGFGLLHIIYGSLLFSREKAERS